MQINKITSSITKYGQKAAGKLGNFVNNNAKAFNLHSKFESDGVNVAFPVFMTLVSACTVLPRLIMAGKRNPNDPTGGADERREILTRDIPTIVMLVFVMKGLQSILSSTATKKTGVALTNKILNKSTNVFQKVKEYFSPNKGVVALNPNDVAANYRGIKDGGMFVNMLKYINEKGGNSAKAIVKDAGKHGKADGVLTQAAKELFSPEQIAKFNNITPEVEDSITASILKNPKGFEKLQSVLNDKNLNPISKFADRINAIFQTCSLAFVATGLGVGLPKLNEAITKNKYLKNPKQLQPKYEDKKVPIPSFSSIFGRSLKPNEIQVFHNFLGRAK